MHLFHINATAIRIFTDLTISDMLVDPSALEHILEETFIVLYFTVSDDSSI